ncbi:MAG: LysR family transcriptional regulator [Acidimicrobiales bacterium]|nr:LysR family transcriptional regulator [Acidimicrobiales bacterium]
MDLRQLAALVGVAETGSFSAAARAMHTVQSNVSTHIARLERELGVSLVDRTTGTLTPEGQVVVRRARHIQVEIEALATDVAAVRDEVAGDVRIGCIGTVSRWLVPLVLERIMAEHPKIHVVVVDATTTSLVPQLLADRLDLAVVNLPVNDPELVIDPLFEEDRLVVAPHGHPLAGRGSVRLEELGEHELLLEPKGTSFRDELDTDATAAGVTLRPRAEVDGLRLIATLAFQGFGAAIIPATAAPPSLEGSWDRVRVEGIARRSVGLARQRRGLLSAPARALREAVQQSVQDEAPGLDGVHPYEARLPT